MELLSDFFVFSLYGHPNPYISILKFTQTSHTSFVSRMLAWAFCLLFPWICQQPIAITPYGIIEGTTNVSADGFKAHIFLGIPYAKPPIAELRYEVCFRIKELV